MNTWHPVTQPPSEVGLYEIRDAFERLTHPVQWDGRQFRHAESGNVFPLLRGDVWRSTEGEKA